MPRARGSTVWTLKTSPGSLSIPALPRRQAELPPRFSILIFGASNMDVLFHSVFLAPRARSFPTHVGGSEWVFFLAIFIVKTCLKLTKRCILSGPPQFKNVNISSPTNQDTNTSRAIWNRSFLRALCLEIRMRKLNSKEVLQCRIGICKLHMGFVNLHIISAGSGARANLDCRGPARSFS